MKIVTFILHIVLGVEPGALHMTDKHPTTPILYYILENYYCCYSVHCPTASSCYDNRPLWACLLSTWQCPMVGLLRATRVIWRASQSPHLEYWDLFICLFIYLFLMRSPEIISSDQIPALDSGTSGKLQLGPELGSTRPSHQPSMKHSSADSRMGSAHYKEPSWGLSRKGRPCGESRRTTIWKQPF